MTDMDDKPDPIGARIVQAAARAFTKHGFAGVSTAAIAREAKTSKREIYERFESKDALFEDVMKYLCSLGATTARKSAPDPETSSAADDDLRVIARAVLTRFALPETRGVLAAAIGATSQFPSILEIFWEQGPGQAVDHIATVLQDRFSRGEIRKVPFHEVATAFVHDCCGPIVLRRLFDPGFEPEPAYIDLCIDTAYARLQASIAL